MLNGENPHFVGKDLIHQIDREVLEPSPPNVAWIPLSFHKWIRKGIACDCDDGCFEQRRQSIAYARVSLVVPLKMRTQFSLGCIVNVQLHGKGRRLGRLRTSAITSSKVCIFASPRFISSIR